MRTRRNNRNAFDSLLEDVQWNMEEENNETVFKEKVPATGGKLARSLIRQGQYITVDAASGAACCNDLREVVAWACSVEVAPCEGAVRCPQSAPRPLARFVSMISAKLRRGHALSAEHEFGAKASRVDGVACARKTGHMLLLMMMMDGDAGCDG